MSLKKCQKILMKAPKSPIDKKINELRETYERNEEVLAYNPIVFSEFCPRLFNDKHNDFIFKAKSIQIQSFFIENNNGLTIHNCPVPIPHPTFIDNIQDVAQPPRSLYINAAKCAKAFNTFFKDTELDENFHELSNNYLIYVVFPTLFQSFISDDFNTCAKDMIMYYLDNYNFDGYFDKLLGSFMISSFYAISSLEDDFYMSLVLFLAENKQIEDISMEFIFETFMNTFNHSLSCFSEHINELLRYTASKSKKRLEIILLDYFIAPILKRIIHSPSMYKTIVYSQVMKDDGDALKQLINNYISDEKKMDKLFEAFWSELYVTASRIPLILKDVCMILCGNHPTNPITYFSILDLIYIEKLCSYVGICDPISRSWPKKIEKDIYCFQNAFLLYVEVKCLFPKIVGLPKIGPLIVKPGEEQMKKKWDMIHEQIVSEGISPIEEFITPKYSPQFIRLALEWENNVLNQTNSFKDIIRQHMSNLRPMDENIESINRNLNEVSLKYSMTFKLNYPNVLHGNNDDYVKVNSVLCNEMFNYLETVGMNVITYYAKSKDDVHLLIRSFRNYFNKSHNMIEINNDNQNLEVLKDSILKACQENNKNETKGSVKEHFNNVESFIKMFHLYLQKQALLCLDNISLPRAKSDNVIEGPPDGMNLETFFSVLQLPIDYLRAIVMLHNNQSSHFEGSQILGIKSFADMMNSIIDTVDINSIIDESDHHHAHARVLVGQSLICFMFNNDLSNDLFVSFSNLVNSCKSLIDNRQEQLHLSEDLVQSINAAYSWFNKE